jgi:hypothetical protein
MPTYTTEFRQRARLALQAAGYPTRRGALNDISLLLTVPRHTLKRWFRQTEPPSLNVNNVIQPMLQYEVQRVFAMLDHKREDANYAQLSRALSQLVETLGQLDSSP